MCYTRKLDPGDPREPQHALSMVATGRDSVQYHEPRPRLMLDSIRDTALG